MMILSSIEGLFGRQLRCAVKEDGSDLKDFSEFEGQENEISFITTYVPLGSQSGGLCKVIYRFEEIEKRLIYAQKIITRPEDLNAFLPDVIDPESKVDLMKEGWDLSIISNIDSLLFKYQSELDDKSDPEDWQEDWNQKGKFPQTIALSLSFSDGSNDPKTYQRIFYTNPLILLNS